MSAPLSGGSWAIESLTPLDAKEVLPVARCRSQSLSMWSDAWIERLNGLYVA
jgi:hypothetical protein